MAQFQYLGSYNSSLSSLDELARPIVDVLNQITAVYRPDSEGGYPLAMLFSSRGSYPFLKALDYLSRTSPHLGPSEVRIVPHIFSIENLFEIVADFDRLRYESYRRILDPIYRDIAARAQPKIDTVCADPGSLLIDWDEVNTGNNMIERMKIYRLMQVCPDVPFIVTSFIGDDGEKIHKKNIKLFHMLTKRSPRNYSFIDIKAKKPISWSDDEAFFSEAGLIYPGIAVPKAVVARNDALGTALPQYYDLFFRYQTHLVAQHLGLEGDIRYKLVQLPGEASLEQRLTEEDIMNLSLQAYEAVIDRLGAEGQLRKERGRARNIYRVDPEAGHVYGITRRKTSVLLERRAAAIPSEYESYRNPFVLFYPCNAESNDLIESLMAQYFTMFRKPGA